MIKKFRTQLGPSELWDLVNFVHLGNSLESITLEFVILQNMPWISLCTCLGELHHLMEVAQWIFCMCWFPCVTACWSFGMPFSLLVIYAGALACYFFLKRNRCIHWLLAHPLAFEALWVRLKRLSWRFGMTHNTVIARCHARYMYWLDIIFCGVCMWLYFGEVELVCGTHFLNCSCKCG